MVLTKDPVPLSTVSVQNVRGVLEQLGIEISEDGAGKPVYTIDWSSSSRNDEGQARYDPKSRKWDIDSPFFEPFVVEPAKPWLSQLSNSSRSARPDQPGRTSDWTYQLPDSDHLNFIRSRNWAKTPLGPLISWPRSLQLALSALLSDPRCCAIYWGPECICIYNAATAAVLGALHPKMMGTPYMDESLGMDDGLTRLVNHVKETRVAVHIREFENLIMRNGAREESLWDAAFMPIFDPDADQIEGIYASGSWALTSSGKNFESHARGHHHPCLDIKTDEALMQSLDISQGILTRRRSAMLNKIARNPDLRKISIWQHVLNGLETLERDIPFAILYAAYPSALSETSTPATMRLEGTIGVPRGHPAAPEDLEFHANDYMFAPAMRQSMTTGDPITFLSRGDSLPSFLSQGVEWRGFGQPSHTIIVMALSSSGVTAGFLILGTNPFLDYNEDYKQFFQELERLASAGIGSSLSFEQAKARELKLNDELTETEKFVRRIADISPTGLYSINGVGNLTWANANFFRITGLSNTLEGRLKLSFIDCIHEDDRQNAIDAWIDACKSEDITATDFKLKRMWTPPQNDLSTPLEEYAWIRATYAPQMENGQITSVTGCLTDISSLKWAEQINANAADAAREAKRLQEKFIDVTSHEMRNPLSAIMQCADGIVTYVDNLKSPRTSEVSPIEILESISEGAQTILLCAGHQKRIVDDILTVSKLDSTLLTICPTLSHPVNIAKEALQMFKAELEAFDITGEVVVDPAYHDEIVYCDPSRLSQILVNLLTNAIKFSKGPFAERKISVHVGSSPSPPDSGGGFPQWFPTHTTRRSSVDAPLPGDDSENSVYITFAVQDAGRGITADEMKRLFHRFIQANAKTHIEYGGSGLGLFISRELTELMGGMIGASSVPDKGSTFAFYIKARRPNQSELVTLSNRDWPADPPIQYHTIDLANPRTSSPQLGVESSPQPVARPQILLVEDNLINQKVLSKQLIRLGATVHIANHGLEALALIHRSRYWRANNGLGVDIDVILMDLEMPVMDGLTCTREIRRLEEEGELTKHLTLLAVTANARSEQMEMAVAAGVDGTVTKPFKVSELMEKIQRL